MKLIYYMELLKEAIKSKISISAEEERAREIELKRAYHDNIAAKAEIESKVLLSKIFYFLNSFFFRIGCAA